MRSPWLPNTACIRRWGFCGNFEHFSGFELFLLPNIVLARPSASQAHRWAARIEKVVQAEIGAYPNIRAGSIVLRHIYFETEQFLVRQWSLGDVDNLFKIMSDSRVHTYTGDTPWSKERTKAYINLMLEKDFRTLDIFHGACVLKQTNELIGFTGLNPYLAQRPELEWQLGVPFWGKGYATEIGKAVIKNAFAITNIVSIFGMANPANKASLRALEKIGMRCLGLDDFRGHQDMFYKIDKEFYLRQDLVKASK